VVIPAVALERVSKDYGSVPALREVSLAVAQGEWLGLLGPNGSGKSTLLHCVARLVPFSGRVLLDGEDVARMVRRSLARRVALVAQKPVLPAAMTVADYVLLGRTAHLDLLARATPHDLALVRTAVERLDLGGLAGRRLGTLSGGETQRAVLARALAQEPRVLVLDEPTSALDVGHQQQVFELLDGLRRERGLTVIAAMHDLTLAAQYADRVALLSAGLLVASGAPGEVLTEDLVAEHYDASVTVIEGPDGQPIVVPSRRPGPRPAERETPRPER
jgi:iron complex transport system ATP-binding protein